MYMVAGSQADRPENNMLTLLQLTELHKTYVAAGKSFNLSRLAFDCSSSFLLCALDRFRG